MPGRGHLRVLSAILNLKEGTWIDENLLGILRALPPHVRVEINPDSIV